MMIIPDNPTYKSFIHKGVFHGHGLSIGGHHEHMSVLPKATSIQAFSNVQVLLLVFFLC